MHNRQQPDPAAAEAVAPADEAAAAAEVERITTASSRRRRTARGRRPRRHPRDARPSAWPRRRFVALELPGRLTRRARTVTLHLAARWPWQTDYIAALTRIRALPALT